MALNLKISNTAASAAADAVARLLDNGYLKLYTTAQPTDADTALGAQTLLATLRFNATSAPGASGGVLTFNAITADTSAAATGAAAWYRALKSDGTTVVMDGSVGIATSNLVLNSAAIQIGAQVSVSSMTFTQSKA